ncbi:MAG: nucleotidyltransferase family protein [Armatimonadetes bacterium]|nr:nucleotidyltransferase family protein [Armatimonadota bacterium]
MLSEREQGAAAQAFDDDEARTERGRHSLLLAALARGPLPDEASDPEAWREMAAQARRHGVAGLAFARLSEAGKVVGAPAEAAAALRIAHAATAAANLARAHLLRPVLPLVRRCGADPVALKGFRLAWDVYGDPGARTMTDVDLIIAPDRVEACHDAMVECGWQPHRPAQGRLELDNEIVYKTGDPRLVVELHWRLVRIHGPFTPRTDEILASAVGGTAGDLDLRLMCPEQTVIHTAIHPYEDGNVATLRGLCDIDAVVRRAGRGLDWERLASAARAWRGARQTWLALALSRDLLGTPVPSDVLAALVPALHDQEAARRCELAVGLVLGSNGRSQAAPRVSPRAADLADRRAGSGGLRQAASALFPDRATIDRLYPGQGAVGYAQRWRDVVRRHGGDLARLALREPRTLRLQARQKRVEGLMEWLAGG